LLQNAEHSCMFQVGVGSLSTYMLKDSFRKTEPSLN